MAGDLISRASLLAKLREQHAVADAGEDRNPDDDEWRIMREMLDDAIRLVEGEPEAVGQ